jgi:hypothetical protein
MGSPSHIEMVPVARKRMVPREPTRAATLVPEARLTIFEFWRPETRVGNSAA